MFWNSGEDTDGLPFFQRIADARKLSSLDFARMMALSDMADFDSRIVYVGIMGQVPLLATGERHSRQVCRRQCR